MNDMAEKEQNELQKTFSGEKTESGDGRNPLVLLITQAAAIAALYVVLALLFAPISYGAAQVRIAEALTILPLFTPAAIPGLFVGCILANLFGGAILLDVVFGSLATLIGAVLGYVLRRNRWLVPVPAILANAVIIPWVLRYGYGVNMPLTILTLYITAGEIISCFVLGEILASVLLPLKGRIFEE